MSLSKEVNSFILADRISFDVWVFYPDWSQSTDEVEVVAFVVGFLHLHEHQCLSTTSSVPLAPLAKFFLLPHS